MRRWLLGGIAIWAGMLAVPERVSACHACRAGVTTVCPVPVAPPPGRCVVEMVPYTVMQARTRINFVPEVCTVMAREPITQIVERQRVVCRPVYETSYVQRTVRVCRPVYDTQMVPQTVCVQRPVTTTRQVASVCYEPYTRVVNVPVMSKSGCCGLGVFCGKLSGGSCHGMTAVGCISVAQTCYRPVNVARTVYETRWVTETQVRQVPVMTCRWVTEDRVQSIPITRCRMVREVVTDRVPVCVGFRCVPRQLTRMRPVPVTETVPVTCYRPVMRWVEATVATPQSASPQAAPAPQSAPAVRPAQPARAKTAPRLAARASSNEASSAIAIRATLAFVPVTVRLVGL